MNKLYQIKNQTEFDTSKFEELANIFIPYHQQELQWKKPVNINLVSDEENSQNPLGKTAYYDPSTLEIVIYQDGRHIKDMLRSLSHELVHHLQNCKGTLTPIQEDDPQYAQNDENLRKCEEEAYLVGNMIFRDWEDQYKNSISIYEDEEIYAVNQNEFLITWNRVDYPDDVYIVAYPDLSRLPNNNDFKSSYKSLLRQHSSEFDIQGVLTLWKTQEGITPETLSAGDVVPLAVIDYKIAGDYKPIAYEKTTSQQAISTVLNEAYTHFNQGLPNDIEDKVISSISLEKESTNPNWIGTAKYGKNGIIQTYFWANINSTFFVVSDHSLYGSKVLDLNFDSKKEAREFSLKELKDLEYETDIVTIVTYRDAQRDYQSIKKRRHHYESTQHSKDDYENLLLERVYKKFNIYNKLGDN
jgi:hypothetical protein